MESSAERRGTEPEKKDVPVISQERIDAAYAILVRDGGRLFEQSPSIVHEALAADGVKVTDEELMKGEIAGNDAYGARYAECDARLNPFTGGIAIEVHISEKFYPAGRERFDFKKTYHFAPSPEAQRAHQEEQVRQQQQWDAEMVERAQARREALPKLRAFIGDRLGDRLTVDDWKHRPDGLGALFGDADRVPEGASWTVEETEEKRLLVTFRDAQGNVADILEFGAD